MTKPQAAVETLSDALQTAVLLTTALQRELVDARMTEQIAKLRAALIRATDAADALRRWATAP